MGIGPLACAALASSCNSAGPLTPDEVRRLPGSLYFASGGSGHDEHAKVRRFDFRLGVDAPVTAGAASAFAYGLDPSRRRLALVVGDEVALADPDGGNIELLAPSQGIDWSPTFSPDGRYLVFESARASFRDLYRIDLRSKAIVRLTDNPEGNFDPSWSPQAGRIALASSRAGQLDVWVMQADGSAPKRLTRHSGDSIKPRWSPSGRFIAFISGRDGPDELYVVPADGGEVRKLSAASRSRPGGDGAAVSRFAWHPTEDRIVYSARRSPEGAQLYVVDLSTGVISRLSREGQDDREPSWSPSGEYIAFSAVEAGASEIFIMRADGRRRSRLTHTNGQAWLPTWTSAPRRAKE